MSVSYSKFKCSTICLYQLKEFSHQVDTSLCKSNEKNHYIGIFLRKYRYHNAIFPATPKSNVAVAMPNA